MYFKKYPSFSYATERYLKMYNVGKRPLCNMRTAKVQMNVASDLNSLYSSTYTTVSFCKRTKKAQISLHECAGWSGPALSTNCIRALFVHCAVHQILFYYRLNLLFWQNISCQRIINRCHNMDNSVIHVYIVLRSFKQNTPFQNYYCNKPTRTNWHLSVINELESSLVALKMG